MARKKRISREDEDEIVDSMNEREAAKNPLNVHIDLKCKTENQRKFISLIQDKEIVIGAGFAGTGKTFLSCAKSLL